MDGSLPEYIDPETWADYCEYRRTECKKPFGPIAEKRALKKLERLHKAGYDVVELIDHSISSGWLGIFAKEDYRRQKRPGYHASPKLEVVPAADKETARAEIAKAKAAI